MSDERTGALVEQARTLVAQVRPGPWTFHLNAANQHGAHSTVSSPDGLYVVKGFVGHDAVINAQFVAAARHLVPQLSDALSSSIQVVSGRSQRVGEALAEALLGLPPIWSQRALAAVLPFFDESAVSVTEAK